MLNSELIQYINDNIFPLYKRNDKGHDIEHIKTVIERSLEIMKRYNVDENMVYTIAAYHDLGHYKDRNTHEIISAEIFYEDLHIKKWFTEEQIVLIKEAIEDHRASSNHEPRSIYGKIIATADKMIIDISISIKRSYNYGIKHFPHMTREEQLERIYNHLLNKYGPNGYSKIYLYDFKYECALKRLRVLLSEKKTFMKMIEEIIV